MRKHQGLVPVGGIRTYLLPVVTGYDCLAPRRLHVDLCASSI